MRVFAAVLVAALLAACGADGPPVAPAAQGAGISISGEASVGVASDGGK